LQRDLESTRALFRPHAVETISQPAPQETFSSVPAPEAAAQSEAKSADSAPTEFVSSSVPDATMPLGTRWLVAAAVAVLVLLIVVAFPKLVTLNASTGPGTSVEDSMQKAAAAAPFASSQKDVAAILMPSQEPVLLGATRVARPASKL